MKQYVVELTVEPENGSRAEPLMVVGVIARSEQEAAEVARLKVASVRPELLNRERLVWTVQERKPRPLSQVGTRH